MCKKLIKSHKKMETSKFLLMVLLSGFGIISISSIVYTFIAADASPLVTLIEKTSLLCNIAVGFYFWKAKCENMQKYKKTDKIGEIRDEN